VVLSEFDVCRSLDIFWDGYDILDRFSVQDLIEHDEPGFLPTCFKGRPSKRPQDVGDSSGGSVLNHLNFVDLMSIGIPNC
jgi:hypothetical protein